jgi:tRNA 2-thiouridine synthesizing protein A
VAKPEYSLDITAEVCPMTYVRAKLALEEMSVGEEIEIRLRGGEPLDNVPRTLRDHGHEVLEVRQVEGDVYRVLVRKQRA